MYLVLYSYSEHLLPSNSHKERDPDEKTCYSKQMNLINKVNKKQLKMCSLQFGFYSQRQTEMMAMTNMMTMAHKATAMPTWMSSWRVLSTAAEGKQTVNRL